MARKLSLMEWLDSLPDTVCGVRVRVGTHGNPPTVALITIGDVDLGKRSQDIAPIIVSDANAMREQVEQEAIGAGYPEDCPVIRLHAVDSAGRQIKSWQRTNKGGDIRPTDHAGMAVSKLADTVVAMAGEMRRTVDILSETLSHRENTLAEALDASLRWRQEAQDSQLAAMASEMMLDIAEEPADPLQESAARALDTVTSMFTGGMGAEPNGGGLDLESLKAWATQNPDIVAQWVREQTATSEPPPE